jgi:FkbM family methyltransferase
MARITNCEAAQAPGWVIYDFGMNNGDDVAYYLLKADRVVGVDANPELCREVRTRFAGEIASGRVTVLNVALAERETAAPITFYVHKTSHVLSQLPEPPADLIDQFTPIQVPCRTPASIVREFGDPLYVKIDVEGFDSQVLQNLFAAGMFPPEISAESHSVQVFACLVANGYDVFNLVEGSTVAHDYGNATIATLNGPMPFRFKEDSAGPFGEDIKEHWEDANTFFRTLAISGLGWRDIHASRLMPVAPAASKRAIAVRRLLGLLRRAEVSLKARTIGHLKRRS